jgi:hypothetical protein
MTLFLNEVNYYKLAIGGKRGFVLKFGKKGRCEGECHNFGSLFLVPFRGKVQVAYFVSGIAVLAGGASHGTLEFSVLGLVDHVTRQMIKQEYAPTLFLQDL